MLKVMCTILMVYSFLYSSPVAADELDLVALNQADTAWILVATALVLLMTLPGLALFYAGLVRTKNVLSVLIHCLLITCVTSVLWLVAGYSLAFGDANPFIGGLGGFMIAGMTAESLSGSIPEYLFFAFQMTFFIITPALIVGAFVERMKLSAMLIFVALWSVLLYAPVCHWVWGPNGFMLDWGVKDLAGGIVVHITAGVAATDAARCSANSTGAPKNTFTSEYHI